jgi:hypothetical protein
VGPGAGDTSLALENPGGFGERKHFSWLVEPSPRKSNGR